MNETLLWSLENSQSNRWSLVYGSLEHEECESMTFNIDDCVRCCYYVVDKCLQLNLLWMKLTLLTGAVRYFLCTR